MSDLKVTDRRWWAREDGDAPATPDEPRLKPTYVEELEAKVATKDQEIQSLIAKYRGASDEFDQARARLRKEVTKDVERGRRSLLVSFLEVLDNLDRALDAAGDRGGDPFVQGVSLVRQQFLATLEGLGVRRLEPLGSALRPRPPRSRDDDHRPRRNGAPDRSSASCAPGTSSATKSCGRRRWR